MIFIWAKRARMRAGKKTAHTSPAHHHNLQGQSIG
jgi:hypothetical protein